MARPAHEPMEPNPYQSPQSLRFQENPAASREEDPTRLLAEIRDIQRELLDLSKQAVLRQRKFVRFGLVLIAVLIVFLLFIVGNVIVTVRSLPVMVPVPSPPAAPR